MGLAMSMAVTVTPPEVIGVLVWWSITLATPVIIVTRWRRRHDLAPHRRQFRVRLGARGKTVNPPPPGTPTTKLDSSRVPAIPSRSSVAPDALRLPVAASPTSGTERAQGRETRSRAGCPAVGSVADETLEPLSRYVDFRRRLELAVSELEARLCELLRDRWRIEPYPLTGERRNTLLILGENGVFVVSATYAPGHWDDVIAVNRLARKIQRLLPGYPGDVQPAICHPFTTAPPRIWHRPDDHGDWIKAWVIGGDSVIDWLEQFGAEHGLDAGDLERFDQLAKPDWLKPAIPTAPTWPPIKAAAPSGEEM